MPRSGPGVFTLPATYLAVDGELATASQHNDPLEDLEADANTPRPIVAGGTGADTAPEALTALGVVSGAMVAQGRLSLTTGVPVTTSDVTAAGTIYYVPYIGQTIALYNGTDWVNRSIGSQISLALTATSGKPYDVFVYDNAGTATLETLVWTNDTTRATALAYQNGVLCKSGALTRRYVGTFYATASNQTEDSAAKRMVWNMYNRVRRPMRVLDATASWNYTLTTIRQARATTTNELNFVRGLNEDSVDCRLKHQASNSTGIGVTFFVGIGLDSTTAYTAEATQGSCTAINANLTLNMFAFYDGLPGLGAHRLVWLESSTATGTTQWLGSSTSGLSGSVMA